MIGVMVQLIVKRFFLEKYITLEILLNARMNSQEPFAGKKMWKKTKMELSVPSGQSASLENMKTGLVCMALCECQEKTLDLQM